MNVKYTIPYKSYDNTAFRIDLLLFNYSGDIIQLRGAQDESGIIEHTPDDTDDPYSPIVSSKLQFKVINQDNIDVNELQNAQDRDFVVELYRADALFWRGFLISDDIQYPLLSNPTVIQLSATDGLTMLKDMPYVDANLPGAYQTELEAYSRCPLNYIRQILFANLGIFLPIRWSISVVNSALDGDVMANHVQWSVDKQGFYSYQSWSDGDQPGPTMSCSDILSGILSSFQSRIYQSGGKWIVRRVNDLMASPIHYVESPAYLGIMILSSGNENLLKQIGRSGLKFINEDAIITNKPGLKTCKVTYNANVRSNILPNGNLDIFGGFHPLYWDYFDGDFGIIEGDALDGRTGRSASLSAEFMHDEMFTMTTSGGELGKDGLPIDTLKMVKKISFSFLFSPTLGFDVDGDGFITWDTEPFQIKVVFNAGLVQYFLNEFGFWQLDETFISIVIPELKLNDIAKVAFDKFQGIIMPTPDMPPVAGDTSDIQIIFKVKSGQTYSLDNITLAIDSGNDVYESTAVDSKNTSVDSRELNISSSFGGYMLSNYMTNWSKSDTECFFKDALIYEGTLTGLTANAIMRFRYKNSKIFNGSINVRDAIYSYDSVYLIDGFQQSKFMPLNSTYNTEKCEVSLICMECRNDIVNLAEKYYNSNDDPLSN